jgi:hypothetical protein
MSPLSSLGQDFSIKVFNFCLHFKISFFQLNEELDKKKISENLKKSKKNVLFRTFLF